MRYLSVKNFERFQHYKDRRPPWIKLYTALLDDYDFALLPDTMRAHLMLLWLLAACVDNKIPNDARWVATRIGANEPVDLEGLIAAGWLEEYTEDRAKGKREEWSSRYVSAAFRAEVLERDNNQCVACRSTENLEIDHIIPISQGGTGEKGNLQTLCRTCNRTKRFRAPSASAEATPPQMRSLEREGEKSQSQSEITANHPSNGNGNGKRSGDLPRLFHLLSGPERDTLRSFVAARPSAVAEDRLVALLVGWTQGLGMEGGKAATPQQIVAGLADYMASEHRDYNPRHIRSFVAREMRGETKKIPARRSAGQQAHDNARKALEDE